MKIQQKSRKLVLGIIFSMLVVGMVYAGTDESRFNGWQTVGPNGGDIRAMTIDPRDKSRLYVTTLDSQIYTSTDAGKNWRLLATFARPQVTLDNILIDVEDSNIIYVSGHRHKEPGGFMYSKDAGQTWKEAKDLKNEGIHALAQSSKNPNMLIAGSAGKVFISYNRGEDWKKVTDENAPFINQLIDSASFDPRDSNTIFIGTTWRPYKSTDGGKTWKLISKGMIDDSDVFAIDIDPVNPDHIISSACSGIYESYNAGELWAKVNGIPSQSRRTKAIVRNPTKNGGVYAGTTEGFWMSADNGKTWGIKTQRELEVNSIAVHPDEPKKVYIATNNYGIMVSNDGGQNFSIQNGNFTSRFMRRIVADNELPNRFYATTKNTATGGGFIFISDDGGQTWNPSTKNLSIIRVTPTAILQDKQNPNIIYVGTSQGVIRSLDRGKSWLTTKAPKTVAKKKKVVKGKKTKTTQTTATQTTAKLIPVLEESINDLRYKNDGKNTILAATDKGLFKTNNILTGWEKISFGDGIDEQVMAIHQSPAQPSTIWAGTAKSGLIVSKDNGSTWQKVTEVPNDIPISAIETDPQNPNRVYVGTGQTFYLSRDGGATFVRRGGGLPVGNYTTILINPNNSNEIFVASSLEVRGGVYHSNDAGQTWKQLDTKDVNVASRRVWTMIFDPQNTNRLLIGTHSSGIYRIEKDSINAKTDSVTRPRVANNENQ
jgi:photosystem II stability/assembly factor-like uncharacterized protein